MDLRPPMEGSPPDRVARSAAVHDREARSAAVLCLGLVLLAVGVLIGHSLAFNFVTDDAYISFVYSRHLAQDGQLVFNLGERVEGYTNFLWTVLIAALLKLGVAAELSSRVMGTLCGAATLFTGTWLLRELRRGASPGVAGPGAAGLSPWDALPALILCGVPGYACWSSGGLETQLFTALVTLGAALYLRDAVAADDAARPGSLSAVGAVFGLAALTRPEGLLFFGLTALHLFSRRVFSGAGLRGLLPQRREWAALGWFALFVVPHLLWRRWYYGYWVPNTFYVKSSGGMAAWQQGGYYLLLFARQQKLFVLPLFALAGLFTAAGRGRAYRLVIGYALWLSAVFLLYVASVGGDFMGLHRFLMPVVPLNAVAGALGLWALLDGRGPRALAPLVALGLLGLHGANAYAQDVRALTFIGADQGVDTPGYLRHYTLDRAAIGRWLGQNVRPDDYQVVGGAGAQVYYAGIRALDSFGLCDEYVAHRTPALSTRPGHQKFAPLEYVLSRQPPVTILTYNVYRIEAAPYRPTPPEAAMWRARGFHYVSVQVPGLSQPWYSFLKRIDRSLGPLPRVDEID